MMRKHQKDFEGIATGIVNGSGVKIIDIVATPGAGKSSIPIQATKLIKARLADKILWVVPRSALQNQGERGFFDPFFREMFNHDCLIRAATNDINPCRGTDGFVTTYQAISSDKYLTVLNEVKSKKYIIILDEPHHLEKNGVWHESIDKIVMAGHFLIKMTGTLGRGDKKEIAYINYKKKLPYFKNCDESRLIVYSRVQALKEKAILPIEFHLNDGQFEWERANGDVKSIPSFKSARTPTQQSESLFTALNSEFAAEMLRSCVIHWRGIKKKNPGAKLLVITADYNQAKEVLYMLKRSIGLNAMIATSHESKEAIKAINRFKFDDCSVLVTIAMAYEGLDVPAITHECVLTNIRSREWIEQMLARGVRIDKNAGPYESQKCYVFAPMDKRFKKVVGMIKRQQVAAIEFYAKVKEEMEPLTGPEIFEETEPRKEITPISSSMTGKDQFLMGIDTGLGGVQSNAYVNEIKTVKEQEIELRQVVHSHINKYCFENRYKQQRINSELKIKHGKCRDHMTLPELEKLHIYIKKFYPVGSIKTIKDIPGISIQRGCSKRVTRKVEKWTGRSEILKQSCYDPIRNLLKGV
jgi:superfamily II DNA or RNA helicase